MVGQEAAGVGWILARVHDRPWCTLSARTGTRKSVALERCAATLVTEDPCPQEYSFIPSLKAQGCGAASEGLEVPVTALVWFIIRAHPLL